MSMTFEKRATCEACGSTAWRTIFSRSFTDPSIADFLDRFYARRLPREAVEGQTYEIAQCEACGFLWQVNVLNEEGMGLLYGQWIDPQESLEKRTQAFVDFAIRGARDVARIASFVLKKPKDIHVLDFGMGWGQWCLMAKAFGYDVAGCELSPERIAYARDVLGVRVVQGLEAVPMSSLDYIHCEQVLEHVREPLQLVRQLVDRLAPGGYVRIGVPDGSSAVSDLQASDWRASKGALQPLEHINTFTAKTLIDLAGRAGLSLVKFVPVPTGRGEMIVRTPFIPDVLFTSIVRSNFLFQKVRS